MDQYTEEEFMMLTDVERQDQLLQKIKSLEQVMLDLKIRLDKERSGLFKVSEETERRTRSMGMPYIPAQPSRCIGSSNAHPRRTVQPFTLAPNSTQYHFGITDSSDNMQGFGQDEAKTYPVADDRPLYIQKLLEIDNLCKAEMARMAAVKEKLEPLNQIASDWKIQDMVGEDPIFNTCSQDEETSDIQMSEDYISQSGKMLTYVSPLSRNMFQERARHTTPISTANVGSVFSGTD